MLNPDRLSAISPQRAAQVAFRAVDVLQDMSPEDQQAGMALLFLMVCRRHRMTPREVSESLEIAGRRLADALRPSTDDKPGDTVRALRMYLKEEL
jgi:hypothetical protein